MASILVGLQNLWLSNNPWLSAQITNNLFFWGDVGLLSLYAGVVAWVTVSLFELHILLPSDGCGITVRVVGVKSDGPRSVGQIPPETLLKAIPSHGSTHIEKSILYWQQHHVRNVARKKRPFMDSSRVIKIPRNPRQMISKHKMTCRVAHAELFPGPKMTQSARKNNIDSVGSDALVTSSKDVPGSSRLTADIDTIHGSGASHGV